MEISIKKVFRAVGFALLILWAITSLLPLCWLFISAFTPSDFMLKMPPEFNPLNFRLDNFTRLFEETDLIWPWTINTVLVATSITVFNIFFCTLAGYVFAKMEFWGRDVLFAAFLSTMMIPAQVTLIPLFLLMKKIGLYNSHAAIILPQLAGVFGVFLLRQYIKTFPGDLLDAARIDGATELQNFFKLIVPMAKPAMAVLGIFVFMGQWKNLLWPLIILQDQVKFTLEVGLATLQQQFATNYGILMAGAGFSAVPMILIFFAFQKYLTEGLTVGGSLKG